MGRRNKNTFPLKKKISAGILSVLALSSCGPLNHHQPFSTHWMMITANRVSDTKKMHWDHISVTV